MRRLEIEMVLPYHERFLYQSTVKGLTYGLRTAIFLTFPIPCDKNLQLKE
jgi:hypothetical protein